MAFYRGVDGSVSVSGTVVAQVKSWSMTSNIADLDTTALGDTWKSSVAELGSWSGDLEVMFDDTATGQGPLFTYFTGATPGGAALAVELRVSGSTKKFTGNIIPKSFSPSVGLGKVNTLKVAFTGTGQLTLAWT